jgi:ABC-type lipoprotein release transport system permease subunit
MNLAVHPVLRQWIAFHLNVPFVAGCFVTALAIAVPAAWFPARRAARLRVVQALQYE